MFFSGPESVRKSFAEHRHSPDVNRFEGIVTNQAHEAVDVYSTARSPISKTRLVRELDNTVEIYTVTEEDRVVASSFWRSARITGWSAFLGASIGSAFLLWKGNQLNQPTNSTQQQQDKTPLSTKLCWFSAAFLGVTAIQGIYRAIQAGDEEQKWSDPLPELVKRRQAVGLPTTGYEEIYHNRGYGVIAAPNEVHFAFHAAIQELQKTSKGLQDSDVIASIGYAGLDGAVAALNQRFGFVKDFVKYCPLEPAKLEYAKLGEGELPSLLPLVGRYKEVSSQFGQYNRFKELEIKNARLEGEIKKESAAKISAIVGGAVGSVVNTACVTRAREDYDMRIREENKKFDDELTQSASKGAEAVRQVRIAHDEREKEIKARFDKRLLECGAGATNLATMALAAAQVSKDAIELETKNKENSIELSFKANVATDLLPKVRSLLDDYENARKQRKEG
eukprot:TRINITY_DN3162_c0_g1_i2.p1 TRINITY_DN3162_c0_g1~~TRINITY_DN3162_c0_g1_i2.p1  ORF type:complete len:450 (+),score=95.71 TRINITY_DN3162_c0_g1_i2:285-1634(+)